MIICYPRFLTPYSDLDLALHLAVAVVVAQADFVRNRIDELKFGSGSELEVVSEEEEVVVIVVVAVAVAVAVAVFLSFPIATEVSSCFGVTTRDICSEGVENADVDTASTGLGNLAKDFPFSSLAIESVSTT